MERWQAYQVINQIDICLGLRERALRIAELRRDRAFQIAREAGLGCPAFHIHNALVSLHHGKPWRDVDYDKVRQAGWILSHRWDGVRLYERWRDRKVNELCKN